MIKEADLNFLFSLKPEDVNKKLIEDTFTYSFNPDGKDVPPRINYLDKFTLPEGKMGNDKAITTTVGRYFFNMFVFSPNIIKHLGYVNKAFDVKTVRSLNEKIVALLLDDVITTEDIAIYIDKMNWFGFSCSYYFSSTINTGVLIELPAIKKAKKELFEKYKVEIEKRNPMVISKIEKELLDIARKELATNPAMKTFLSGGAKDFDNIYKNQSIMRGAIKDMDKPGEYHVCLDNLATGIKKENLYKYADLSIEGSYSRGVETAEGGYLFKQFCSAFQTVMLDKNSKSDCGTKKTIKIAITSDNKSLFNYRYILEGNKLIMLVPDAMDSYIGRIVNLRSPLFCTNGELCSKCAGMLYHKMGLYALGLATGRIASNIMLLAMKSFHNSTLQTSQIKIHDMIKEV
jgi:hypothetical protein